MGSKKTTTNNSTSVAEMPAFQKEFLTQEVLPFAKDIAARDFEAYKGDRVAGLTPLQQQAMRGYGGLQSGAQQYGEAADIYRDIGQTQAGQLATTNLDPYMSPYQQSVIDASLRTLGGAQEQALNQQGAQATAAGAFGGSRQGIAEAETRKAYGQQASDLVTRQMQAGFENAQKAAQADMARQMQAATLRGQGAAGLGAAAGQSLAAQQSVLGAQMQAGENARMLQQADLDNDYAEFMRRQQFPLTGLNALTLGASGIPAGYGTTTGSSTQMTRTGGMGPALGAIGSFGMGMGPYGFNFFK